jgi:hypothetical protein
MYRVVSQNIAVALVDLCRVGKRRVRAPLPSGDRGLPKETEQAPPFTTIRRPQERRVLTLQITDPIRIH